MTDPKASKPTKIVLFDDLGPIACEGFAPGSVHDVTRGMSSFRSIVLRGAPLVDTHGMLALRRFDVRVAMIPEERAVLRARLEKLWRDTERNIHHRQVMHAAARELEFELDPHGMGADFKRK